MIPVTLLLACQIALAQPIAPPDFENTVSPEIIASVTKDWTIAADDPRATRIFSSLQSTAGAGACSLTVIEKESVNAFYLPGGKVYATSGLLSAAKNDAELAFVLAHEIGHYQKRHFIRAVERMMRERQKTVGAGGKDALLRAAAKDAVLDGFGRDTEFEADEYAFRLLTEAGYNPGAGASFLSRQVIPSAAYAPGDSHPSPVERIKHQFTLFARLSTGYIFAEPSGRLLVGNKAVVFRTVPAEALTAGALLLAYRSGVKPRIEYGVPTIAGRAVVYKD